MYATGDEKLNQHIFGGVLLKPIDFARPEIKRLFKVKNPTTKSEIYQFQLEKLDILISHYTREDFDKIKFLDLNSDQILVFLGNKHFTGNPQWRDKFIEAVSSVARKRELKIFKERKEIMEAVRSVVTPEGLASLSRQSYVGSLAVALQRMSIED